MVCDHPADPAGWRATPNEHVNDLYLRECTCGALVTEHLCLPNSDKVMLVTRGAVQGTDTIA